MNSSGNTRRSAPSAAARTRAARALAALPSISPTVGFNCASVIMNSAVRSVITYAHIGYKNNDPWHAGLQWPALDRSYALGEGKQPEQAGHYQRHADGGRAQILDPADLWIVIGGEPVGELLDRGIEQFHDQHQ